MAYHPRLSRRSSSISSPQQPCPCPSQAIRRNPHRMKAFAALLIFCGTVMGCAIPPTPPASAVPAAVEPPQPLLGPATVMAPAQRAGAVVLAPHPEPILRLAPPRSQLITAATARPNGPDINIHEISAALRRWCQHVASAADLTFLVSHSVVTPGETTDPLCLSSK